MNAYVQREGKDLYSVQVPASEPGSTEELEFIIRLHNPAHQAAEVYVRTDVHDIYYDTDVDNAIQAVLDEHRKY